MTNTNLRKKKLNIKILESRLESFKMNLNTINKFLLFLFVLYLKVYTSICKMKISPQFDLICGQGEIFSRTIGHFAMNMFTQM